MVPIQQIPCPSCQGDYTNDVAAHVNFGIDMCTSINRQVYVLLNGVIEVITHRSIPLIDTLLYIAQVPIIPRTRWRAFPKFLPIATLNSSDGYQTRVGG